LLQPLPERIAIAVAPDLQLHRQPIRPVSQQHIHAPRSDGIFAFQIPPPFTTRSYAAAIRLSYQTQISDETQIAGGQIGK
jgi:hypothetical protein